MNMLARLTRPLVWSLSASSSFLLRMIGAARQEESPVTDHFDIAGYRFEVVDMDRNRVDKVLVARSVLDEPDLSM
jgi:CBS domain containing-hemolysin-like protein